MQRPHRDKRGQVPVVTSGNERTDFMATKMN